jgi:hypothetical protein
MSIETIISEEVRKAVEPLEKKIDALMDTRTELRPVMTLAQLAEHLQVSKTAIQKWVKRLDHPLPVHYLGADPRFHLSEVNVWSREEAERKLHRDLGVRG